MLIMEPDSTDQVKCESTEDDNSIRSDGTTAPSTTCMPLPPCQVCMAPSSGYHFGILSCEACKSFYRRTTKLKLEYTCLSHEVGQCNLRQVKGAKPPCPACRFKRCVALGMSLDAAKKGRYSHAKRVETVRATTEYWLNHRNEDTQANGENSQNVRTNTDSTHKIEELHLPVQIKQELPSDFALSDDANSYSSAGIPMNNESAADANNLGDFELTETIVDDTEDSWQDDIAKIFETKVSKEDEDTADMDKFIQIVGDAYDQQQFVSKLFSSKVPGVIHAYLIEEHCKNKKHPGQKKDITPEHHFKVFSETGIDLAGRIETFRIFAKDIMYVLKKTSEFGMMIPGFSSLSKEDRLNIFKVAESEQIIGSLYPVHFYDEGICVTASFKVLPKNIMNKFFDEDVVNDTFKICKQIQELYFNKKENALFAALILTNPSYCVTAEGKYICRILRNFSAKCLVKTLASRIQGEKLAKMFGEIPRIVNQIAILSKKYYKDREKTLKLTADLNATPK